MQDSLAVNGAKHIKSLPLKRMMFTQDSYF
jgi:hypothetical protein